MESSVCPEHASHRGTVKYDRVLTNRTAEPQFRGPEKLHLKEKKKKKIPDWKTPFPFYLFFYDSPVVSQGLKHQTFLSVTKQQHPLSLILLTVVSDPVVHPCLLLMFLCVIKGLTSC